MTGAYSCIVDPQSSKPTAIFFTPRPPFFPLAAREPIPPLLVRCMPESDDEMKPLLPLLLVRLGAVYDEKKSSLPPEPPDDLPPQSSQLSFDAAADAV